jgi:DNA-binding PadR family transcriptional regulator
MAYSARLKGNLDLLLMSVLQAEPAHGYAIITRLRDGSDGAFDLPEGTIYPALHKLETDGLVRSWWDETSGRRRRTYSLTADGVKAMAVQRREWQGFQRGMQMIVGGVA